MQYVELMLTNGVLFYRMRNVETDASGHICRFGDWGEWLEVKNEKYESAPEKSAENSQ